MVSCGLDDFPARCLPWCWRSALRCFWLPEVLLIAPGTDIGSSWSSVKKIEKVSSIYSDRPYQGFGHWGNRNDIEQLKQMPHWPWSWILIAPRLGWPRDYTWLYWRHLGSLITVFVVISPMWIHMGPHKKDQHRTRTRWPWPPHL